MYFQTKRALNKSQKGTIFKGTFPAKNGHFKTSENGTFSLKNIFFSCFLGTNGILKRRKEHLSRLKRAFPSRKRYFESSEKGTLLSKKMPLSPVSKTKGTFSATKRHIHPEKGHLEAEKREIFSSKKMFLLFRKYKIWKRREGLFLGQSRPLYPVFRNKKTRSQLKGHFNSEKGHLEA